MVVYFVLYQLGAGLLIYYKGDKYSSAACFLIAAAITFFPLLMIYRTVPKLIPDKIMDKKQLISYFLYVAAVVCVGIAFNVIITKSGLISYSAGFQKASNTLSDGTLLLKILCHAIAAPIIEELMMRGIVLGQLCLWYGPIVSVLLSSIFFGILHGNIVQFLYAVIVGIALGAMYVKTKRLSLCMLAHGLLNLIVIL